MRLLIAIPVYNERKYVGRVLDKIRRFHPDMLVIDDGSTDGTGAILDELAAVATAGHPSCPQPRLRPEPDRRLPFAETHGYDWVITMDCDEQHEPEIIPEFIRQIRKDRWDIISGSRYLRPPRRRRPAPRRPADDQYRLNVRHCRGSPKLKPQYS